MINHNLGTYKIVDAHEMFPLSRGAEIMLQGEKFWQDAKISLSCPRISNFEGFSVLLAPPNQCSVPNLVHLRVKPENMCSTCFILCLRQIIPEMTE